MLHLAVLHIFCSFMTAARILMFSANTGWPGLFSQAMSMSHVSGAVSCVRTSQDLCSGNHEHSAPGLSSSKPGAAEECGSPCHSHQAEANRAADLSLLSNEAAQVHNPSQAEASPEPQVLQ